MTKVVQKTLKIIFICLLFAVLGTTIFLGFYYRDDLQYIFYAKKMQLDNNIENITVMTYNIRCKISNDKGDNRWEIRASQMAKQIQQNQPTIICLQEVKSQQLEFFKKFLNGYGVSYAFRDESELSECTPVFCSTKYYELVDEETFWLSDTPEKMSNTWNLNYNRVCTLVTLKDKRTDKQFVVASTHLDFNAEKNTKCVKLISDKIKQKALPSLVMGDFNSQPTSSPIIEAKKTFFDCGLDFDDETTRTINYFDEEKEKNNIKIDYIFRTKTEFNVISYKVDTNKYNNIYVSDHYPIFAEVKIK